MAEVIPYDSSAIEPADQPPPKDPKVNRDYYMVGQLDIPDLVMLSKGEAPIHWRKTKVTANLVRIARYFLNGGKVTAKDIDDRLYGPVTQKTEVSGNGGGPIQLLSYLPFPAAAAKKVEPEDDAGE